MLTRPSLRALRQLWPGSQAYVEAPVPKRHWSWRPDLWVQQTEEQGLSHAETGRKLGDHVALFHDCPLNEITLRQMPADTPEGPAKFAVSLDVLRFDGSYLSLAIALPDKTAHALTTQHILKVQIDLHPESPIDVFGRLNLQSGPNIEKIVHELPKGAGPQTVAFELAYLPLHPSGVSKAWVDVIFDNPAFNQILLRDLTVHRRPRAPF